jgi:hypothetical protein
VRPGPIVGVHGSRPDDPVDQSIEETDMTKGSKKQLQNQPQGKPRAEKLQKITLKDLENVKGGNGGGADPVDDGGLGPSGIN